MKKRRLGLLTAAIVFLGGLGFVNAATKSSLLEYKGTKAQTRLETDFRRALWGKDYATATTSFITNNNNFKVAVRLERWDDENTMGDYKYDSDKSLAQVNYTWSDVYAYISRHSIDNWSNTVEYAVDTHRDVERIWK